VPYLPRSEILVVSCTAAVGVAIARAETDAGTTRTTPRSEILVIRARWLCARSLAGPQDRDRCELTAFFPAVIATVVS